MSSDLGSRDTATIALHLDAFGRLVLALPGGDLVAGVVPVRCFPFSAPFERVSLCDEHGHEVHCIEDLSALPPEVRNLLERELARREFVPVILEVLDISPATEPSSWRVRTDRGDTRFVLASEDHVRRLGPHGVLIADSEGVRFRVLDTRTLDPRSRKLLKRYL